MALEPCRVCGSLTSTEEEICMICGYPRKGRQKSIWIKWVAYFLILLFGLPLILSLFYQFDLEQFKRRRKRIDHQEIEVTKYLNKIKLNTLFISWKA